MEVRQLLHADERRYQSIREQAVLDNPSPQGSELQREKAIFSQSLHNVLGAHELNGTRIWGVFDDVAMAGVAALSPILLESGTYKLWLWGLYVHRKYRGTPASRLLMEAVRAWGGRRYPGLSIMGSFHVTNRHAMQMVTRFGFAEAELLNKTLSSLVPPDHVVVECANLAISS